MDIELVNKLLEGRNTARSRWEYINFVIEGYGEHQGRALLAQLHRRRDITEITNLTPALIDEAAQIDLWLSQYSQAEIQEHLDSIEANESTYWAERLGREAAVDLLTRGRVTKEVMERAILLDEDNYRKFAETSTTIIKVVSEVTREVEQSMGVFPAQLPEGEPQ